MRPPASLLLVPLLALGCALAVEAPPTGISLLLPNSPVAPNQKVEIGYAWSGTYPGLLRGIQLSVVRPNGTEQGELYFVRYGSDKGPCTSTDERRGTDYEVVEAGTCVTSHLRPL
jgi:hypothetical protein